MRANLLRISIVLFIIFPFELYSKEENLSPCDCSSIVISTQEQQAGCTANVKRETCPQFREIEQWQQTLRRQRELREFEDRIPPPPRTSSRSSIPSRR